MPLAAQAAMPSTLGGVIAKRVESGAAPRGALIDDRYRLERLLGEGGMGRVFAARHVGLSRPVAVKILGRDWADRQDVVERFYEEARVVGSIEHPGIVDVLDVGSLPDGRPYYVMELVRGHSLRHEYRTGVRRWGALSAVLDLAESITEGLIAAHAAAVIHQDLKPDNILVVHGPAGVATKLIDFGVAHDGDATRRPATVMGTAEYMAPEQAMGAVATPAVDIYALGVILYELLAGAVPLRAGGAGEDVMVLIQKATMAAPSLRQARPELPPRLCDLVDECLARKPQHRPGSMSVVRSELQEIRHDLHRQVFRRRTTLHVR